MVLNDHYQLVTQKEPRFIEFNEKFDELDNKIHPLVTLVNEKLKGPKLVVLRGDHSSRTFFQIVLSPNPEYVNPLHDPFLLIEGYPKAGKVRITQSNASDEGNTVEVDKVDEQLLTKSMAHFLSATVSSLR